MENRFQTALLAYLSLLKILDDFPRMVLRFKIYQQYGPCWEILMSNYHKVIHARNSTSLTERIKLWLGACNQNGTAAEFLKPSDFSTCVRFEIHPIGQSFTTDIGVNVTMEQDRTPLYDSVFQFKGLLQYLKDKSFSDEVSITLRLDDPNSVKLICMDLEIPNIEPDFVHRVIYPWTETWFERNGFDRKRYAIKEQWPKERTVLLTYKIDLSDEE